MSRVVAPVVSPKLEASAPLVNGPSRDSRLLRSPCNEDPIPSPWAVTVAAVGLLVAASFAMDPSLGFPPGVVPLPEPTTSGLVHDVAGPLFIIGLAVAASLTGGLFRQLDAPARWTRLGWVAGSLVMIAFAATSVLVSLTYAGVLPSA